MVGARLAPHLLHGGTRLHYTALIGLVGAFAGASVLQTAASSLGGRIRSTLRFAPPLRLLDSLGGLVTGAAWGLVLAWVLGAVAVRLTANHQPRKIQSELVGTAMTMVTRRTKPIDAATGSP